MQYDEINGRISELADDPDITFEQAGEEIKGEIDECSRDEVIQHVMHAGVIPEVFDHDSTEEKIFAKYCDILFAKSLTLLGFRAEAIVARGDAADVDAKSDDYELVGDAKAFRLSRTAKNAKDFKVESLHQWKKGADYACLLSPRYQYPNTRSQIYAQAIRYDVTLLSYPHFVFLLDSEGVNPARLKTLWQLSDDLEVDKAAQPYWTTVLQEILDITGREMFDWNELEKELSEILAQQARNQIEHWEHRKEEVRDLSHDEATDMLINYMKIDSKIATIRKAAQMD